MQKKRHEISFSNIAPTRMEQCENDGKINEDSSCPMTLQLSHLSSWCCSYRFNIVTDGESDIEDIVSPSLADLSMSTVSYTKKLIRP